MYKQNHQYSYVMKRAANTPNPKPKNTHKNKAKLHSKSKDKKFNPLEYLNSLIDEIHDHRFDTVRKRPPSSHRLQRSSALAYTTPITQRTVSSSKVRSKSSYSQYRKRSVPLRDILRVDIDHAITEEDNIIHFTEETVQSGTDLAIAPPSTLHARLTPAAAARRIQRAWRNFQTLKVVRKYYLHCKNAVKRQREEREREGKERESKERKVDRRKQFERTLKIKKNDDGNHNRTIRLTIGEATQRLQFSQEASDNTTKELIREPGEHQLHEAKTVELPALRDAEMYSSEEYTSKDLKFVIELFRSREESASKEINHQLDTFCQLQAQLTPLECFTSNQSELSPQHNNDQVTEGLSPLIFFEMQKVAREKYELLREKLQQQREECPGDEAEFRHREQQIQGRMRRELRSIERCREDYMRSIRQLKEGMIKLQADSSKIQRLYQQTGRPAPRVRKSYSADTLILKSILEEVTFKTFDIDCSTRHLPPMILQENMKREERRQEGMHPICPTSPPSGIVAGVQNSQTGCSKGSLGCYQFSDSDRLQEEIYNDSNASFDPSSASSQKHVAGFEELDQLSQCDSTSSIHVSLKSSVHSQVKEDPNTALLRQCAEEMQERIETVLIAEIIEEITLNGKIYGLFRPYIEHPFEFKPISDQDIFAFLNTDLPKFFLPPNQFLARLNQKINPNSLEILRLIRDFQFQIDEYELVLPEEIFKAYRRTIEETYAIRIKKQSQVVPIQRGNIPERIIAVLEERAAERRTKRAKFLGFQRDLKIMYMKSVFNCYNELIIETKSFYSFMNGRSSIGPGELTLALREYNWECRPEEGRQVLEQARERVERIIHEKAMLPVFRSYKELQQFQKQMTKQLSSEMTEGEFKWVNYMDEVLEIWQEVSSEIVQEMLGEAVEELLLLRQE